MLKFKRDYEDIYMTTLLALLINHPLLEVGIYFLSQLILSNIVEKWRNTHYNFDLIMFLLYEITNFIGLWTIMYDNPIHPI